MLQLSKDRTVLFELSIGVLLSLLGIGLIESIAHWGNRPSLSILVLPLVSSYFLGGGALSGSLTTLVLMIYDLKFVGEIGWLPYFIFFATGMSVAYLVTTTKDRIQSLSTAQIRAGESQRLKFAAEAGKLGIWEWDIPNDHLIWDDQMFEFYGISKGSFSGSLSVWEKSLHPEDVQQARQIIDESLRSKSDFGMEFRVIRPNGDIRYIQSQALLIRDELGKPRKMFGLNRDITDEKKSLQQIQELNAYLETALEQSQAGIVIAEAPTGAIKFANQAALKITDRPKEQVVDNIDASKYQIWRVADLNGKPLEGPDFPIVKAMSRGVYVREELMIQRPSGETRSVLVNAAPIRRKDGTIIAGIVVFVDMTEQRLLLEKVKTAQKEAEEAMMAKARFLDVAAHELRTPVTAVSLMLQLAQRQITTGIPVSSPVLKKMKTQIDRLSRLVVDLLEVSKLDRGVLELKYEWADLGALITDCISTFNIQFPERNILFTPPVEPVTLNLDPVRIYEVIANLLDNAMKYTPEDSPLEIQLDHNPDHVYFSITDQGPGLSQQVQKRLFGAFERENFDRQKRYSGLGLGLFISRGIAELHGGSIGVRSQEGHGCTFFFNLPRITAPAKTGSGTS